MISGVKGGCSQSLPHKEIRVSVIWDDFAESYLAYVHTILDQSPWEYYVYKDNARVFEFKDPIIKLELKKKMEILTALFETSNQRVVITSL